MTWDQFQADVIRILGGFNIGYGEASELYSFHTAYHDGQMTPREAVVDCVEWLGWE